MYLSHITIENFRCFGSGDKRFEMSFRPGLTALVGQNDSGKSAVIDAIRYALGTTDQEWLRIDDSDFHDENTALEIHIVCRFEGLSFDEQGTFLEYLTYATDPGGEPTLFVHWMLNNRTTGSPPRPYRRPEVKSGRDGQGPVVVQDAREFLRATYLRPLRDAKQALSAGRGSRLSQILRRMPDSSGRAFDPSSPLNADSLQGLSILGIGDLANYLLRGHTLTRQAQVRIDRLMTELSLRGEASPTQTSVGGQSENDEVRRTRLLERLAIALGGAGTSGLGSENLLFMACELLLLQDQIVGPRILLIEEPEAHLHPQRQLTVMHFLQREAQSSGLQIVVTTHSPHLASAINLDNLTLVHHRRAYSMGQSETKLDTNDYRFLQRYLNVTKANLFFARGVMIVEGDAENILIPAIAKLLGRDFTDHGVSVVNVGGTGLRRYARIFQRSLDGDQSIRIPVACLADLDVMPDCAPVMLGKVESYGEWPDKQNRRWRAVRDFTDQELHEERQRIRDRASGQCVETFVCNSWTIEYSVALGNINHPDHVENGLAEEVWLAASLAAKDDAICRGTVSRTKVLDDASREFTTMKEETKPAYGCTAPEVLATRIYEKFESGASKAVAAQYLSELLTENYPSDSRCLRQRLPRYIVEAIEYVTTVSSVSGETSAL